MPGTWKSDYLLNLVLVAKADGEIRPVEVLFLSLCRTRAGGDRRTLADAVIRSYWEEQGASGGLIADEQTLRDMIRMAIIDGQTNPAEQQAVTRFIDAVRIPQTRVEAIIREAFQGIEIVRAQLAQDNDSRLERLARPEQ